MSFLPAVQFGVTLASLGWLGGEDAGLPSCSPAWANIPLCPALYAHGDCRDNGMYVIITYLLVILGDLVPNPGFRADQRFALAVAAPCVS